VKSEPHSYFRLSMRPFGRDQPRAMISACPIWSRYLFVGLRHYRTRQEHNAT